MKILLRSDAIFPFCGDHRRIRKKRRIVDLHAFPAIRLLHREANDAMKGRSNTLAVTDMDLPPPVDRHCSALCRSDHDNEERSVADIAEVYRALAFGRATGGEVQ